MVLKHTPNSDIIIKVKFDPTIALYILKKACPPLIVVFSMKNYAHMIDA